MSTLCKIVKRIDGVMVSVFGLSAVDSGLDPYLVKPKTKIGMCCFSAKHQN